MDYENHAHLPLIFCRGPGGGALCYICILYHTVPVFFWLGGSIEDLVLGRFLYNGASIREGCVDGGFGEMWEVDGVFFSSFFSVVLLILCKRLRLYNFSVSKIKKQPQSESYPIDCLIERLDEFSQMPFCCLRRRTTMISIRHQSVFCFPKVP